MGRASVASDWRFTVAEIPLLLTAAQRRQLRRQLRQPGDVRPYRRAVALLEVGGGQSVAAVAAQLGVSRQSVYNWVEAYRRSPGPQALADGYGPGRPSLWTEELRALLRAALRQSPGGLGYRGVNWTVPLLRAYLDRAGGRRLSEDTIRRELGRLGYVWKRFRYALPADPEREKKTADPAAPAGIAAPRRRAV
jgi:transposase